MTKVKTMRRRIRKSRKNNDRGSALLVTLMVMVGLSLLGLAFVTISETESAISLNERNYMEAQAVAEAGARVVLEWFQSPDWADTHGILPANADAVKTLRVLAASPYGAFSNRYKFGGGKLFDKPFKGGSQHRFFGDETHADVIINSLTDATFLNTFNTKLFPNSDSKVSDIRVYAPPMVNATLNGNGFYEESSTSARYGVATIKVTAEKRVNGRLLSTRWVKLVISEWPFPGPQGPVQSNANISTGGNFGVHWGRMTSERDMEIKRPYVSIPWFNAYDMLTFEWGYYAAGQNYEGAPFDASDFRTNANHLYTVTDIGLEDPWFQARAKGDIVNGIAGASPHVFDYDDATDDIDDTSGPDYEGWTNWFQKQSFDDPVGRDYKLVLFPKIDYEFWKNIAQSGSRSNNNVHYLAWVAGETFTDGIETKPFAKWVNTAATTNPAKPGFYFFDTKEGINPQAGGGGTLTDDISITNADTTGPEPFMMKGFIYVNAATWSTQGLNGPAGYFNYPGEPYRDIGVTYSDGIFRGANDGIFTFDDINNNKRVDIFVESRTVTRPDGTPVTSYFPKKWTSGCTPGFNNVAGANCSEPHEPFLNMVYPDNACCGGAGQPNHVTPKWEAGTSAITFTRKPKTKSDTTGLPIACAAVNALDPPDKNCTSNGWDADGALIPGFGPPNSEPVLDGVLYNEGNYSSEGNAAFFGSVLINGDISGSGTHEVWFDEFLVKGGWQDKFKELPRVYVTAHETDQ